MARCVNTRSAGHPIQLTTLTPKADHQTEGYSATMTIQQLALQVFSLRLPKNLRGQFTGNLDFIDPFQGTNVDIWPITGIAHWPPRLAFDDTGFVAFSERWGRLKTP